MSGFEEQTRPNLPACRGKSQTMNAKKALIASITIACMLACSTSTDREPSSGKGGHYWNDIARFLAGMPLRPESPLARATGTDSYRRHLQLMEAFWQRVMKENLSPISAWRESNIRGKGPETALYPFSGADFINLHAFYPGSRSYVMIAMEEPGNVPDPLTLPAEVLAAGLASVYRGIENIAVNNYFTSGVMMREMTNSHMPGTLPALLIFSARLGFTVLNVEHVGIAAEGSLLPLDVKGTIQGTRPQVTGTRITMTARGERNPRTLVYLRMRLGPATLAQTSPEGLYLKNLGKFRLLLKSAIYLLHADSFRDLRTFLLEKSRIIIQDDSGIPYAAFDRTIWDLNLFGSYTQPRSLKDLPNPPHQISLAQEYTRDSRPLPFNFGYGVLWGKGRSNLLLAAKKGRR
jgi:hypothetical protein